MSGAVRKPENFVAFAKRLIVFLMHKLRRDTKKRDRPKELKRICESPLRLRLELNYDLYADDQTLKYDLSAIPRVDLR